MSNQVDGKLYNIAVQVYIQQVTTSVKFPCVFFIQWRTNDQKSSTQTAKHSPQGQKVVFDQSITLKTNIIYDKQKKSFYKKQSQLQLNLISKSRPDQPKLVGRLTFDLAAILNENPYPSVTQIPLNFCSVHAFIILSLKVIEKIETDIQVHEYQKSLSEGVSFASSIKVSTPNFGQEKNKQQSSSLKQTPQLSSKIFQALTHKRQYSGSIASPKNNEQNILKGDNQMIQTKQASPKTTIKDMRHILDEKGKSKSFKSIQPEEESIFESRRLGSTGSEVDKQQSTGMKAQLQSLKIQSSKKLYQQQRSRFELQKKTKQSQFVKLQLRQKQGLIDQINGQLNLLKNQNARLREENVKVKDESVKLTLKLSEIRDTSSKSQQQLLTLQRQLKRYEKIGQNINNANQAKKQLTSQIVVLKQQLSESEKKVNSLAKQKSQFQELINLKEVDYQKKYEEWRNQKTSQTSNKQNLLIQLSNAQQKCKAQSNLRVTLQNKVNRLQQQINKLTEISNEFLQAKNSWYITEGILKDQINSKTVRVTELQEVMISTADRVRWLEGQVQLLDQSSKQSRKQYLRLQQQKNKEKSQLIGEIQKMNQYTKQLNENVAKVQTEKSQAINTINSLIQKYGQLNIQHEGQSTQNSALLQNYEQVSKSLNQYKQRCAQFEQLLLSSNQMRQKQSAESAERQKNMYMRIVELENQLTNANDHILINEDRIQMLDDELRNRQELVSKLQKGLQKQIQRSEDLNIKLLGYMQRAQKMKDIMAVMEDQHRRITELIIQQELTQFKNKNKVQDKQRSILQLLSNLQQSISHGKELEETFSIRQTQYRIQIDSLNVQLSEMNAKLQQLQEVMKNNGDYIVILQSNLAQNNQILGQKDKQAQQTEFKFNQEIQSLKQSKSELQLQIQDLCNKISKLNEVIVHKDSQIKQKEQKFNNKDEQLFIKQTEMDVLSTKITQLQSTITSLQNQINDYKNDVLLKQELIQQQTNRFNQLASQYEQLQQDQATFDIVQHKQTLKESNQTIVMLQEKIRQLQKENSKITALERSVKIKTIQLNSMKFKGKGQPAESNQLLKLKNQEIASLIAEREKLSIFQIQCVKLQEKIVALQNEIELIEEEKFNIESESNERALILEEAREQNRKLMEQITIIGQKNSELQRIIAEMIPNQNVDKYTNLQLTFKSTLTNSNKGGEQDIHSLNLLSTMKLLKQTVNQRVKSRLSEKLLQILDKISAHQMIKDSSVQVKLKSLSRDFSKLKILLMKVLETKTGPQKTRFIDQVKNCESVLVSILNALE